MAAPIDLGDLEKLFVADVVCSSDGGGVVGTLAARIPIRGDERVAKFVAAIVWVEANGPQSVLLSRDGVPYAPLTATARRRGLSSCSG